MPEISKPLVSVVIPAYNSGPYIKQTIDSVLAQSYKNFELIIINDGSNDNTISTISAYTDYRITIINQKNSGGPANPRNRGINAAKGEYICLLDADDLWFPNKLKITISQMIVDDCDLLVHWEQLEIVGKNTATKILKHGNFKENVFEQLIIFGNELSPSATVIKREFVMTHNIRFNENANFRIVEDYDFWLQSALLGAKFSSLPLVLSTYKIHADGISQNRSQQLNNLKTVLDSYYDKCVEMGIQNEMYTRYLVLLGLHMLRSRKFVPLVAIIRQWTLTDFRTLFLLLKRKITDG